MNKLFTIALLLFCVFSSGCKSDPPIKQPTHSTSIPDLFGREVIDIVQLPGADTQIFRDGVNSELQSIQIAADGSVKAINTWPFQTRARDSQQILRFADNTSFTAISSLAFLSVDSAGNVVTQGNWKDVLGLGDWSPGNSDRIELFGRSDDRYCIRSYADTSHYRINCYDQNSDPIWSLVLDATTTGSLNGLIGTLDSEGNLYLFLTVSDHRFLRAYSNNGALLWEQPADDVAGTYSKTLIWIGGKLVLVGADASSSTDTQYYFQQFNQDGTQYSSVSTTGYQHDLFFKAYQNNSILMMTSDQGGHLDLTRINIDGTEAWKKILVGRSVNLEFKTQQQPVRVDEDGNIALINMSMEYVPSLLYFPVGVTNRYYISRFDSTGKQLQEDLIGRNRYRIVSDTDPTRTVESGFAPDEFVPTPTGYVAAGVNTYDLAEDNPNQTYSPPLVVNHYHW